MRHANLEEKLEGSLEVVLLANVALIKSWNAGEDSKFSRKEIMPNLLIYWTVK